MKIELLLRLASRQSLLKNGDDIWCKGERLESDELLREVTKSEFE